MTFNNTSTYDDASKLRAGQVITMKDGVSYVGIIPLPATDFGRHDEVVIGFGGGGKSELNGAAIKPALIITSYNLQRDTQPASDNLDWARINTAAYGGFVIELGDAAEYGDFSVFSRRMQSDQLTSRWDSNNMLLHVEYRSGQDVMEMGCGTDYKAQSEVHRAITPGQQTKAIRYRKINGAWPYLPPGIERDTSLAQQETTGRLEKNGAVLATGTQRKADLQTEPIGGTYTGYNPLPDPTDWLLTVPGGVNIRANGKVSLLRVSVQPKQNRLWIDYAAKESQCGPDMASHLLVSGMPQQPSVEYNGRRLAERFKSVQVNRDGERAYAVPIVPEKCSMAAARAQR